MSGLRGMETVVASIANGEILIDSDCTLGESSLLLSIKANSRSDGDLSYLNLDWTPIPIIPKFVDIVVNGMSDRLFDVKAYAQDAMSSAKRSKYQDMIEAQIGL